MGIENIQSFVGLVRYIGNQDRNQDGQIQRRELEPGSPLANPDEFRRADLDENGALSPGELARAANHYQPRGGIGRGLVDALLRAGDLDGFGSRIRGERGGLFQGIYFRQGTNIFWDQNGRLESAELVNGGRIQGFNFPPGTNVTFDAEGRLTSAVIPDGEVATTRRGESFTGRIIIEEDQTVRSVPLVYIGRGSNLPSGI